MSAKKVLQAFNPLQVHAVILLTLCYFLVQLIFSHTTHALTLLVDSYHVLGKLIYMFGTVLCVNSSEYYENVCLNEECMGKVVLAEDDPTSDAAMVSKSVHTASSNCTHSHLENKLKNTFGWARIEVVVMLGGCVFLASLSFSLVVEAVQTLIHIDHQDPMHQPISVLIVGLVGIIVHGLCYFLLGGPTVKDVEISPKEANVPLSSSQMLKRKIQAKNCNLREMCRDIVGCAMVMICSTIVRWTEPNEAKYVDPVMSILSASLLLYLKFPSMKESCKILLQTMPDHMDIDAICSNLMKTFPDIVNVHELHIWQLTEDKIISTAHIIFLNPQDYLRINKAVVSFFHENGIVEVTIQPEFFKDNDNIQLMPEYGMGQCLMQCNTNECLDRNCCEPTDIEVIEHSKVSSQS